MKQVPSNTKSYDKDSGRTKQKRKKKKKKRPRTKKNSKKTFNMKAAMGEGHLQGKTEFGGDSSKAGTPQFNGFCHWVVKSLPTSCRPQS